MSGVFVLAAGGTGGHLFPAEALARELLARGHHVHLVTDRRADAFAERLPGIAVHRIRAGSPGGGPLHAASGLAALGLGLLQARRLLRSLRPSVVVGFGGYASVPTVLAAARLGVPAVIHEQNAILGRANRWLAPRAARIATGFPETAGMQPADAGRTLHTGNPVRPGILALGGVAYEPPSAGGGFEILILGGSQGARIFGEIVPQAVAALPSALRNKLRIAQQARPEDRDAVTQRYRALDVAASVETFFADVPERLRRAHLVICRAGASTIAELAAAGRPSLLVPYPHAMDDHQTANAHAFAAAGGGWLMPQSEFTAAALAARVGALSNDVAALRRAADDARRFARRDAAERLAALAVSIAAGIAPEDIAPADTAPVDIAPADIAPGGMVGDGITADGRRQERAA